MNTKDTEQVTFLKTVVASTEAPFAIINNLAILNYTAFWRELVTREDKLIFTANLIKFMNTLKGKNKSGGKNGISRLQFFLNAFSEELALLLANNGRLSFVGDDHFYLATGGTGTDDPDFYFTTNSGNTYTIEAKMYFTEESYYEQKKTTNFHAADYCLAFIISTKQWRFSRKVDDYDTLYEVSELSKSDPWLEELILPESINTVQFSVQNGILSKLTDAQVPSNVNYIIYTNNVSKAA
jgi:hypothetical protein